MNTENDESGTRVDRFITSLKNNPVISVLLIAAIGIMAVAKLVDSISGLVHTAKKVVPHKEIAAAPAVKPADTFATALLTFGDKGTGPGFFTGAHGIAVSPKGDVYISEYSKTNRVQRFDADGHFLSQWIAGSLDKSFAMFDIAIDPHDVMYMAYSHGLYRCDAMTGKGLSALKYDLKTQSDWADPNDAKVAPSGELVTSWSHNGEDTFAFYSGGRIRKIVHKPVSQHSDTSSLSQVQLALDGKGNIYAIDHYGTTVYKYSPDGVFINRFGEDGIQPGQLHEVLAIAVNGKGHVFVSDGRGIQVFDENGRYLNSVATDEWVMGMAFNNSGELYAVNDSKVTKYRIDSDRTD